MSYETINIIVPASLFAMALILLIFSLIFNNKQKKARAKSNEGEANLYTIATLLYFGMFLFSLIVSVLTLHHGSEMEALFQILQKLEVLVYG